jgi:hypothetical protein
LIAYEYARALCDEAHAAGKLVMAGGTPHNLCWLAPYADVMGSETDWNPAGQWRPTSDDELLHRRILCGRKPYCLIMNTAFEKFGPDLVEKYMKRCLAYGIFPGFHSHNGAERPYFTRPKLYDRDRPLFRKYVPLCKAIAGAGWEPVTLAHSSDERIHIERFGRKYLTVFNDSTQRKTVTVRLDGLEPAGAVERITGKPVAWNAGSAELTLGAEDLAVLEVK